MTFIPTREGAVDYFDINGKTYRVIGAPNAVLVSTDTINRIVIGENTTVYPLSETFYPSSHEYDEFINSIINPYRTRSENRYADLGDSADMKANCEANNEMNYDTTEIDKFLDEFCARKD